ncbi:MAG: hypothetical protein M1840_003734 [Geoglossum simile]|nr:MAG: hypothetical protein M1840_003734 [Geoglossum simile]
MSGAERRKEIDRDSYRVGWICASVEDYVAARNFLDEKMSPDDSYTLGKIRKHNVAIDILPEPRPVCAATVARDMRSNFPKIRICLMVGVGGGAPSARYDIRLGDIVVGAGEGRVFQYNVGETIQKECFHRSQFLDQSPPILQRAVNKLLVQHESKGHGLEAAINAVIDKNPRLQKKYKRPDSTSKDGPAIHYGPIASGDRPMEDALVRDKPAAEGDVLCFEMEAAGLMNGLPCLVIRGICDYSDSHKNKKWQGYAAMAAAAYAKDLLYMLEDLKSIGPAGIYSKPGRIFSLGKDGGVDSDSKDNRGRTPLSRAAANGSWGTAIEIEAVAKLLLARDDVGPDSKENDGMTPLLYAAASGHEVVVKLLIAKEGVDVNCGGRAAGARERGRRGQLQGQRRSNPAVVCCRARVPNLRGQLRDVECDTLREGGGGQVPGHFDSLQ